VNGVSDAFLILVVVTIALQNFIKLSGKCFLMIRVVYFCIITEPSGMDSPDNQPTVRREYVSQSKTDEEEYSRPQPDGDNYFDGLDTPVIEKCLLSFLPQNRADLNDDSVEQGKDLQQQIMDKICKTREIELHKRKKPKKRTNQVQLFLASIIAQCYCYY
jgi:hypothetical protein